MLRNKYLIVGFAGLALLTLYFLFAQGDAAPDAAAVAPDEYRRQVTAERSRKDQFFRTNAESPIPDKTAFAGLRYFTPNPAYRVTARLEPFADRTQKLVVRMSDGSEEVYDKFAHAVFSLDGKACRLLIVRLNDTYSILFRDATSGQETYGGGRYLDLDLADHNNNHTVLDFNAAYNPYCAYNPSYACPLPPAENTLPVAVRAGERYETHE